MSNKVRLSLIQCELSGDSASNHKHITELLNQAKNRDDAQIVLIPELYLSPYFCKTQDEQYFDLAHEAKDHPYISFMQELCKDLSLVLPVPFFEKCGNNFYNSVAVIDADGENLGIYRKSHIPDGPGYQEKFYFRYGDTGFLTFKTRFGCIGVGICWDQWFSEVSRIMTLQGADLLLFPTAIGSEPKNPDLHTKKPWQRVMQGHAVCNMIPIAAANRIGVEDGQRFYGSSFVADEFGEIMIEMGEEEEGIASIELDLRHAQKMRNAFGFFRDRRPELYGELCR